MANPKGRVSGVHTTQLQAEITKGAGKLSTHKDNINDRLEQCQIKGRDLP